MDLSTVLPASVVDLSKRSNIVTIFCAIPELGSVFPVNIDIAHSFIGDLKRKIKEAKPHTICFDADMLRLYLAKSDGMWLNSNDDDVRALKRGEVRERVGNLMLERLLLVENEKLNHDAYFGNQFEPTTRDVHVLIDIPEDCNFPGRNNTITISCAIPGAGSVFRVHIDNRQRVGDLKNKIKEAKPNLIRYDADLLKLYLAKNRGGWLSLRDDNTSALLRREVRDGVKDLMKDDLLLFCDLKLNHNTVFGKRFSPVDRDIHVLVKEAEDPTIVRHYKKRRECVKTTRDVLFKICTFIVVVALAYGINPADEKGCITSGVPVYVCFLVAIAAGLLYGGMHVVLDIKEKAYEDEIVKAYMTMGYPYQPIP